MSGERTPERAGGPAAGQARCAPARPISYGGQAVIEGVMMRGPKGYAVAVRRPSGEIVTRYRDRPVPAARHRSLGWPLVRGMASLVDSLVVGTDALLWSADQAVGEDEKISGAEGGLAVFLGLAVAVVLFVLLPTLVVSPLVKWGLSRTLVNVAEGLVRLLVLVGYVAAIGWMPDVRRVFEYHGAEHKVINAYDAGGSWDPDTAASFGTAHPRCGTSFLLFVVVVSVALFAAFGWPNLWVRTAIRLALLPVVAGLAYELMRLGANSRSPFVRWLAAPGLWLQAMTTRAPDRAQLEVANRALALLDPPPRSPAPRPAPRFEGRNRSMV